MLEAQGPFAPLVSPFTDDGGALSEVRLARLVRRLLDDGVTGFVTSSDTGEFWALSFSERKALLEIVVRESQGSVPVIAHVSTLSTMASMDLAQHAARHGARAAVIMPPYYGNPSQEEVLGFLQAVAAHANLPVIVVDPTNQVSDSTVEALAHVPRLTFAASADYTRTRSDAFVAEDAVISPLCLLNLARSDDAKAKLWRFFTGHNFAATAKAALEILEFEAGPLRPPMRPLDVEEKRKLEYLLVT